MPSTRPIYLTEAHRDPDQGVLHLAWSDGHRAAYPYDYLRGYCPCAMCQGHTADAIRFRPTGESVAPESIEPVGNYAISIRWSDAHATGIYRFDFLREICPCDTCSADREGETPSVPRS